MGSNGITCSSIVLLQGMLDAVPLVSLRRAVADGKPGHCLADCEEEVFGKLPPRHKLLPSCEQAMEMARRSPLMNALPCDIENLPSENFVAALIIYTMEEPVPFYKLITKSLNAQGVSKHKLRCQLPFLKLLTVCQESIPKDSSYWYLGVLYRGQSVDQSPLLQYQYDHYQTAFAPGTIITFAAPTSTTTDPSIAGRFTRGIQFVFQGDTPDRGPGCLRLPVTFHRVSTSHRNHLICFFPF